MYVPSCTVVSRIVEEPQPQPQPVAGAPTASKCIFLLHYTGKMYEYSA
jgi:hypothetical protein